MENSTKYNRCGVAVCAMISMLLAGCTNNEISTRISSVGNSYNSSDHTITNPINSSIIMVSLPTFLGDLNQSNRYCESLSKNSVNKMFNNAYTAVIHTASQVAASIMTVTNKSWCWPTAGKIIDSFSTAADGNKGIDISGYLGQPIFATANGKVVYAGNALRGYGNLIIIKHNDDYLSAYAHNNTMLVYEQQPVIWGQKIATMGSTGTNNIRLHFELRYQGNSVNPLLYLQQR